MAVVLTWKKRGRIPGFARIVCLKYTYGNGDTTITAVTGLKLIFGHTVSVPSVATKVVTGEAVAGGTITLTVTDPLAACYVFVTAFGI